MSHYFFDTCAIKHRYIPTPQHARISKIVSDKRNTCYICDMTILEMGHALGSVCRETKAGLKKYDTLNSLFFEDINKGRLNVRTTTQISIIRARNLLRYGGITLNANLGSMDALLASTCLDLAHSLKVRFRFYTGDWRLYTLLREINAFRSAMILQYILTPKYGIPARTG